MELATQSWFEGEWTIRRWIDDRHARVPGRLTGSAVFVPTQEGLDYNEDGMLEMRGAQFPATRRYRWVFELDGRIRIFFDDGRYFHSFLPGKPVSDHLCGEDRYSVEYDFQSDGWRSRWEVRGPLKDYIMETWYSRAG